MKLDALFNRAEEEFQGQNYVLALQAYLAIVRVAPHFTRARYRVGDTLLNLGETAKAKDVYKALAWYYIKTGQPLLGLVVCKMLIAIEPSFADLLEIVCEMYSKESDRIGDVPLSPPVTLDPTEDAPAIFEMDPPRLYDWAVRIAADLESITEIPDKLPRIPLFSHLPEDAFSQVLHDLKLRRGADGEAIITEGEHGDSFFMLADGYVKVCKRVGGDNATLAKLKPGAVFGEMALVAPGPRSATVLASGEVAVLALSKSDAEEHAGSNKAVTNALRKFTRGRFLANLAATSPLFIQLSAGEKRTLISKFQAKMVFPGDIVIEEGEPGRGLYIIMRGQFDVTKVDGGVTRQVAKLAPGDVFGEISLLRDAPTTATVTSARQGEVMFLPREAFKAVMSTHPETIRALKDLSTERLRANRLELSDKPVTDDNRLLF